MFDVQKALTELQQKSLAQIESETAYTWGSRAIAARQYYQQTGDLNWLLLQTIFTGEAIEHAATATEQVLADVRAALA